MIRNTQLMGEEGKQDLDPLVETLKVGREKSESKHIKNLNKIFT